MVPQMVATRSTDRGGVAGATAADTCGSHVLIARPATTGASTTCRAQV